MTRSSRRVASVVFDETAWSEDLSKATDATRALATRTRRRLEQAGQPIDDLLACNAEGRDATSLPGCVKAYIPPPTGRWGLVYRITRGKSGRLALAHLAFGLRHPARGRRASVYQIAHRRLHGTACKAVGNRQPSTGCERRRLH